MLTTMLRAHGKSHICIYTICTHMLQFPYTCHHISLPLYCRNGHERKIYRFLKKREQINEQSWQLMTDEHGLTSLDRKLHWRDPVDPSRTSFESFWRSRCQVWGELAIVLFYVGSIAFLGSCMIYMWSQFEYLYMSTIGAGLAVALIFIGLITGLGTLLILRAFSPLSSSRTPSRTSSFLDGKSRGVWWPWRRAKAT